MSDATCKTCPFYEPNEGDTGLGVCCRNPPAADEGGDAQWPAVYPDDSHDWCGEHPLRQRDRLAAMAMQEILSHPDVDFRKMDTAPAAAASFAYAFADALLDRAAPPEEKTP